MVPEFVDKLTLFIDSSGYNKMKVFLGISQWLLLGFFVHKVLEINFNFSCQKVRNQKKNKGTEYSTFKTKEKRLYFFWFFTCWYSELKCVSKNPAIYNILRWVAWTMGQTNRRPKVWCSKYYCNGRPWFVRWCPQEQLYLELNVVDVILQAPVDLGPFFSSWTKFVPKNAG